MRDPKEEGGITTSKNDRKNESSVFVKAVDRFPVYPFQEKGSMSSAFCYSSVALAVAKLCWHSPGLDLLSTITNQAGKQASKQVVCCVRSLSRGTYEMVKWCVFVYNSLRTFLVALVYN